MSNPKLTNKAIEKTQKKELSKVPLGTWPQSRSDIQDSYKDGLYDGSGVDVMKYMNFAKRKGHQIPGCGLEHFSFYKHLRDLMHDKDIETITILSRNSKNKKRTRTKEEINYLSEPANFLMELRDRVHTMGPGNPFFFPGHGMQYVDIDKPDDGHREANAKLAIIYNESIRLFLRRWLSEGENTRNEIELMERLAGAMTATCFKHSVEFKRKGLARRGAILSLTWDGPLREWIKGISSRRRTHHMGGALYIGLKGVEPWERLMIPHQALIGDSLSTPGYMGETVFVVALLRGLSIWARGIMTEKMTAEVSGVLERSTKVHLNHTGVDILAVPALLLAIASGAAADEVKADIIWGMAPVELKAVALRDAEDAEHFGTTDIWRSRAYDSNFCGIPAVISLTRGSSFSDDERCVDLAAAAAIIQDIVNCEWDVFRKYPLNTVLLGVYIEYSTRSIVDTVYAALAQNWTAKDPSAQMMFSSIKDQAVSSLTSGPIYVAEKRPLSSEGNLWTDELSDERLEDWMVNSILPTAQEKFDDFEESDLSWHEIALRSSAEEILKSPFCNTDGDIHPFAVTMENIIGLSKGTLIMICCTSCASCHQSLRLEHEWSAHLSQQSQDALRLLDGLSRICKAVDGVLRLVRDWLKNSRRLDAMERLIIEPTFEGTLQGRFIAALLEALVIEDALYHGQDLLGYCIGWLPQDA